MCGHADLVIIVQECYCLQYKCPACTCHGMSIRLSNQVSFIIFVYGYNFIWLMCNVICIDHITPLVIYSLEGGHTYAHTQTWIRGWGLGPTCRQLISPETFLNIYKMNYNAVTFISFSCSPWQNLLLRPCPSIINFIDDSAIDWKVVAFV